jgi:hypothetical protein
VPPDLIVNGVWFYAGDRLEEIDSIGVAQSFALSAGLLRCGQIGDPSITITYTRDGAIVDVQREVFGGPFDCEGWTSLGQHLDVPGRYTISFVLDAENAVAESSEANNEAAAVLWVVPRIGGSPSGIAR